MSHYRLTSKAKSDLFGILDYIASDNPEAADRVEAAILADLDLVAANPGAGHTRPDLTGRPVRFWSVQRYPNYLIVYNPDSSPLLVLRILHAARDATRLL